MALLPDAVHRAGGGRVGEHGDGAELRVRSGPVLQQVGLLRHRQRLLRHGTGCQSGPCDVPATNSVSVASIVTPEFFAALVAQAADGCAAKGFYTRDAFLSAAGGYPSFGRTGSDDDSKRKIAAFFAHANHETITTSRRSTERARTATRRARSGRARRGKGTTGAGLQISWNFNYGPAGQSIGFDGLGDPDAVARSAVLTFQTALCVHDAIVSGQGFGTTINAINGALECDGKNPDAVNSHVAYYRQFYQQLGVDRERAWPMAGQRAAVSPVGSGSALDHE
uniref:chitinase n=1 Tax=Oryza brachyantha TaxID=4533 RepID=J3MEJ8_ORYBR